jgi:replicative superfamily II helicase
MMIVYVAPMKALAKERLKDWRKRLENGPLKKKVINFIIKGLGSNW